MYVLTNLYQDSNTIAYTGYISANLYKDTNTSVYNLKLAGLHVLIP